MPDELSNKGAPTSPHCPACARVMRLARITSRFGDLPDLYTFECRICGVSHIEAARKLLLPEIPERLSA
jgi:hypothetical protein